MTSRDHSYVKVMSLGYSIPRLDFSMRVGVYERDTERANLLRTVDDAHAVNQGGRHRSGFCKACADLYVSLHGEDA